MVVFSIPSGQFSSNQKYPTSLYNKASLEHSVKILSQSRDWCQDGTEGYNQCLNFGKWDISIYRNFSWPFYGTPGPSMGYDVDESNSQTDFWDPMVQLYFADNEKCRIDMKVDFIILQIRIILIRLSEKITFYTWLIFNLPYSLLLLTVDNLVDIVGNLS